MKKIEEILIEKLIHFEGNPRFESMIHDGLLKDIEEFGVLVPLLVSPTTNGNYNVIDGERRRKSAVELKIPKLTCIVVDMDEETKWQRAYDLNALNKTFSPMEIAKNFYERKKRFKLTDKMLSEKNCSKISQRYVTSLVALNKLPKEIQILLNKLPKEIQILLAKESLPVSVGYDLSRLAFDVSFPSIGPKKSVKQRCREKDFVWDFVWSKEPLDWKKERTKYQNLLVNKWLDNKITTKNLKIRVDEAIKNEKERREWETKQKQELENQIAILEKEINPVFGDYNNGFIEGLKLIIPNEKERQKSSLNKYLIDKNNLPKDFDDFLYDFTLEINKEMPNENRMKIVRSARNSNASFGALIGRKDPIIFEIEQDPSCPHCGNNIDTDRMKAYFEHADKLLTEMVDKREVIVQTRDSAVKVIRKLGMALNRLNTFKTSLTDLKQED